jgi:hypothetical protein
MLNVVVRIVTTGLGRADCLVTPFYQVSKQCSYCTVQYTSFKINLQDKTHLVEHKAVLSNLINSQIEVAKCNMMFILVWSVTCVVLA